MGVILGSKAETLYSAGNLNGWATVFAVGLILTGFQIYKFVKQMEDKNGAYA